MSLYNMLFGVNPSAGLLLAMLGTDTNNVPRFRDCFLEDDRIVIHTRTGGGNRDYYESEECCRDNYPEYFDGSDEPKGPWNNDLRSLPGFLYDRDDDFDCTYANFYFLSPEKFKTEIEILRDMGGERDPATAWQELFTRLESGDQNDPQVQKAMESMTPVMEKIAKHLSVNAPETA